MTPEQIGNYTYGILGAAYNFDLIELETASYIVAKFPTGEDYFANEFIDEIYIAMGYKAFFELTLGD